jgi:hypothetical protein
MYCICVSVVLGHKFVLSFSLGVCVCVCLSVCLFLPPLVLINIFYGYILFLSFSLPIILY